MDPSVFRALQRSSCTVEGTLHAFRQIHLLARLSEQELQRIHGRLVPQRLRVVQGDALFRTGDRFDTLYEVRTGFFKTVMNSLRGLEQVTGFQMAGELIGLEAIAARRHAVDAIALEDSVVWALRYRDLAALCREVPALQETFHWQMSSEISRAQVAMLQLGCMCAEERLADFLLDLMHRLEVRRFSPRSVQLRMSRAEIGSLLGLAPETVSRMLSKLQAAGFLDVQQRAVTVTDPAGLRRILANGM
jgi:CRP/FNR family transcriptional regulator